VTDVLVIGSGVIGCAIAHRLATRGASVAVVDPRTPGQGASRASAGMLAPFTEGRHDRVLRRLGALSLGKYDDLIAELRADGDAVPYRRDGSIDVAMTAEDVERLEALASDLAAEGTPFERLSAARLRELEPAITPRVESGLRLPAHGAVDVPQLVRALLAGATRRGTTLHHAAVRRVMKGADGLDVETSAGVIAARQVVVAAGCWSGGIDVDGAGGALPVQPVRGQLIVLQAEVPLLTHTIWAPGCYLVPWADGSVMVGATVEHVGFDERSTAEAVRDLLSAATHVIPAINHAAYAEVRVGLRPGTGDDRPIVGRSSVLDGVIYATGHYRNGALLAPLTADAVADLVAGVALDEAWAPCSPARFDL
jgi:glycine oxidase